MNQTPPVYRPPALACRSVRGTGFQPVICQLFISANAKGAPRVRCPDRPESGEAGRATPPPPLALRCWTAARVDVRERNTE